MSSDGSDTDWNYKAKGTAGQKVVVAILLIFPMLIFGITPLYNVDKPTLLGLPFFYWFETVWLVVSAVFYVIAALMLNRMEGGDSE
jgi:hypothetical protein